MQTFSFFPGHLPLLQHRAATEKHAIPSTQYRLQVQNDGTALQVQGETYRAIARPAQPQEKSHENLREPDLLQYIAE